MRKPTRILLVTAPLVLLCACKSVQDNPQAKALFNGKDLSGWKAVSAKPETTLAQVWSARDGMIVCQGDPMGFIHTEKSFTNYRLKVEWRWAPGKEAGNSGVFLRINGPSKALPRCIEAQLKSGDAGALYGFHGMGIDGDPARRIEVKNHELGGNFVGVKKMLANENPPGQWNQYEILVSGPSVTVWVNGKKVNEAIHCEVLAGPIGLQSEGGEIHFRNVQITPMD